MPLRWSGESDLEKISIALAIHSLDLLQETNSEKLVRRELTIALAIHSLDLLQEDNIERLVRREFTIALAIHSLDCTLRNLVRGL